MKGIVLKYEKGWAVEVPSDITNVMIGPAELLKPMYYELEVKDEDINTKIWIGKEIEIQFIGYDEETYLPNKVKLKE